MKFSIGGRGTIVMFFGGAGAGLETDRNVTAVGTFRSGLKSA